MEQNDRNGALGFFYNDKKIKARDGGTFVLSQLLGGRDKSIQYSRPMSSRLAWADSHKTMFPEKNVKEGGTGRDCGIRGKAQVNK